MPDQRTALLCPGRNFGPYAPLLYLARFAARARDAETVALEWEPDAFAGHHGVVKQVTGALDGIAATASPLLVGKSLGSHAAAVAAERDLPAIWLTPLLYDPDVVAALRRATAPFLLVGGTADDFAWAPDLARELSPHICEIAGANHGMFIDDAPLAESMNALGQVGTAIEIFLDTVVWPAAEVSEGSH